MTKTTEIFKQLFRKKNLTAEDVSLLKRLISGAQGLPIARHSELLAVYKKLVADGSIDSNSQLEKLLKKRAIRTMSGVAPVAVLTMPFPCPGKCAYCPSEKNTPQSYLSNEPAVMRAIRCGYSPYLQVMQRLRALEDNGHRPTKIELIVIGGTWSVLPQKYKYWYIGKCFEAANDFNKAQSSKLKAQSYNSKPACRQARLKINNLKKILWSEQKKNEKSKYKIVGLTLETRPDYIDHEELHEMRELGCTRVELGVQAIDDGILKRNKRGHTVDAVAAATALLKRYGLKVTYHIMPGLPGSTPAKDLKMFGQLFKDARFQPDQIKFYPTVVTKGSLLYRWWKAGKYKPYSSRQLQKLIIECKKIIPPYVRVIRLIRDIPEESIVAGNKITNLRQVLQERGAECRCIRCREVRSKKLELRSKKIKIIKYPASGGIEYFISFESADGKVLYGFCRLRLPEKPTKDSSAEKEKAYKYFRKTLQGAALIRELHVYGELAQIDHKGLVQHLGLGKKLMAEAERIAKNEGFKKICVISGIGAREYYRKRGYRLAESYMSKPLI